MWQVGKTSRLLPNVIAKRQLNPLNYLTVRDARREGDHAWGLLSGLETVMSRSADAEDARLGRDESRESKPSF